MKSKKYIIATVKTWNVNNYYKHFGSDKHFLLLTKKEDLKIDLIKKVNPRYIFFPHWSWIIPKQIYANFECVIFHCTDLPYGRGGSPLQNLIVRGVKNTFITALKASDRIDAGPIYQKLPLKLEGNAKQIYKNLSDKIFTQIIPYLIKNEPKPVAQKGKATFFKRRTPEQSDITSVASLDKLYDFIRMLDAPEYPKAFIETKNFRFEFHHVKPHKHLIKAKVDIYEK